MTNLDKTKETNNDITMILRIIYALMAVSQNYVKALKERSLKESNDAQVDRPLTTVSINCNNGRGKISA